MAGASGLIRRAGATARTRLAEDFGGWVLAALLGGYILYATRLWNVPDRGVLPFAPLWLGATAAALAAWSVIGRRRVTPVAAIALAAVAAMLLTDISYLATQGLRDLHLYTGAGDRFLAGQPVYLEGLFTQRPNDLADYPFLYPPLTLPFFAALALLPAPLVDVVWLAGSLAAALATLRLFGLPWRWAALLVLWPPFFQGLQVGNVAVPLALLFALAPWLGAGLVIAAIFKVYSGLASLWLIRERRFGQFAAGVLGVAAAALLTLPLVGFEQWRAWWRGLEWFRASQPLLADYLYGFGLTRYLPLAAALAIAAVVAVAALRSRGRDGLARLGLATAVCSPSLYAHGLLVCLPSFLGLRTRWLWTVLAITAVAPGIGWWLAIGIGLAAWRLPALRRDADSVPDTDASLHPLTQGPSPWPAAPPERRVRPSVARPRRVAGQGTA